MQTYYTTMMGEAFETTAIYPNRVKDKIQLEAASNLVESGSPTMLFTSPKGLLLAHGYVRVVYGDHGPYTEFLHCHIIWEAWRLERQGVGYYDKWYSKGGEGHVV